MTEFLIGLLVGIVIGAVIAHFGYLIYKGIDRQDD